MGRKEILFSVDVEVDGNIPGDHSMLSIGVVTVDGPEQSFYRELKPIADKGKPETVRWLKENTHLDREQLKRTGTDPRRAMLDLELWINSVRGSAGIPVFIAKPGTFDWMWVQWYFGHFLGRFPFGFSGMCMKSYYLGMLGTDRWYTPTASMLLPDPAEFPHTHNALDDAREQAEIFRLMRSHAKRIRRQQ